MKLIFAGDFCPISECNAKFSPALKSIFGKADYSFVNLECPLTYSTRRIEKCGPNLKASPLQMEMLESLGVNCVTMANNHIRDFGSEGVIDTLRFCHAKGVKTVGAGADIDEARKPLLLEKDGIRVAVINVAEKEFCTAGAHSAGANPLDLINILRDIDAIRILSDKIIIVVHGGLEYVPYPSPESVRVLRFFAEQNGVVAVIRHHPHIIQGMEVWKGVPIYYSIGNFYFPFGERRPAGWYKGLVISLDISGSQVLVEHLFVKFTEAQEGGGANAVSLKSNEELPPFHENGLVDIWSQEFEKRRLGYYTGILMPWLFVAKIVSKLRLFKYFPPSAAKRRLIQNLIRCDAHREVLLSIMKGADCE